MLNPTEGVLVSGAHASLAHAYIKNRCGQAREVFYSVEDSSTYVTGVTERSPDSAASRPPPTHSLSVEEGASARGVDGGVTATGVLVRRRGNLKTVGKRR